jgi:hypothetical protein
MGVWDSLDGEVAQVGRGKHVCVTGNWSLLGSWLVRNLMEKGYNVRSTLRTTVGKKTTAVFWWTWRHAFYFSFFFWLWFTLL